MINLEIDRYRRVLQQIIGISSVAGLPTALVDFLSYRLKEFGYEVKIHQVQPDSWQYDAQGSPPSKQGTDFLDYIIAYPPLGKDSGLLLFAHYDTENFIGSELNLTLREDEGRFYGHGIADDKAGVAAILLSIENSKLAKDPYLPAVVFAQAKQGGSLGMSAAISQVTQRSAAIYAHPAESNQGFKQVKTASRGVANFELFFKGIAPLESEENTPVSADPREGLSAIEIAIKFIQEVTSWNDPDIVWLVSDVASSGSHFQVPIECRVRVSVWFKKLTIKDISSILQSRYGFIVRKISPIENPLPQLVGIRANPAESSSNELVKLVKEIIFLYTSEDVEDYDWHSASDIRFPILHLGIPTAGLGCLAGGFYGGKEWIDKDSFHQFVQILTQLSRRYPK